MRNKEQMLYDISIVGFVVTELILYLDTHPNDTRALQYLNHYNAMSRQMMDEFARAFYPLTISSMDNNSETFAWGMAPLPWEVCEA